MAAGFCFSRSSQSTNPLAPLPGVLVFALGLAMLVAPITATALKAAPDRYAGLAAGVNTTVSRLGGLIATPMLGVVITLVFVADAPHSDPDPFATHGLSPGERRRDRDGVPGRDGGRRRALHRRVGARVSRPAGPGGRVVLEPLSGECVRHWARVYRRAPRASSSAA